MTNFFLQVCIILNILTYYYGPMMPITLHMLRWHVHWTCTFGLRAVSNICVGLKIIISNFSRFSCVTSSISVFLLPSQQICWSTVGWNSSSMLDIDDFFSLECTWLRGVFQFAEIVMRNAHHISQEKKSILLIAMRVCYIFCVRTFYTSFYITKHIVFHIKFRYDL